uniref:response regulator n=1 Tax=Halorientalis pallida TaxID=2479928 RepID=UPI001D1150ED|nr:response regulator [Halorientalis pallida]
MATLDELDEIVHEVLVTDGDSERVRTALHHVHLPKLEAQGLVRYDVGEGTVEGLALGEGVGEWLDLAVRREIQLEATVDRRRGDDEMIRVLLVDDEPGLPETIAGSVERTNADMTVTTATSALEAVTALESEPFDCIVSDYQMPAISGLDFLKAVRERDATIPFIVFTAKGSEQTASTAIATGVTDYVRKGTGQEQYERLASRVRAAVDRTTDSD